jgi:hypothetical protein
MRLQSRYQRRSAAIGGSEDVASFGQSASLWRVAGIGVVTVATVVL